MPNWLLALVISFVMVIPCLWTDHIQAGDLASHTYNAWLAQNIKSGHISSLTVSAQWHNAAFDHLLGLLMMFASVVIAERVVVCAVLLTFFWGAFTCITSLSSKPPWRLLPVLAMICYGFVFQMGFFNFYLSLGLCLWAFVAALSGSNRRWLAAPLLLAAGFAHPFPPAWAVGVGVYLYLARQHRPLSRWVVLGLGVAGLIGARLFLEAAYLPRTYSRNFVSFGPDQFFLYGVKYALPALLTALIWAWLLLRRLQTRSTWSNHSWALFSLLAVSTIAVIVLPAELAYNSGGAPFGYIPGRLSLTISLLIVAIINEDVVPQPAVVSLCMCAMLFFIFLWKDASALDRLENRIRQAVTRLPPGQRIISAVCDTFNRQIPILMLDRACIGHCFSYGNYEPSTAQFVVRANNSNAFVMHRHADVAAVEAGTYEVRHSDLPLYQIGLCGEGSGDLCVTRLKAGQRAVRQCSSLLPKF